jgi:hypothetical protein
MRVLEIHPGREQVNEITLGSGPADAALTMSQVQQGLKAALGGPFRIELEPIQGLDGHVLAFDRADRTNANTPAFYLKSDPSFHINGIGIVLGEDPEGGLAPARATIQEVRDLVGFIKRIQGELSRPVSGEQRHPLGGAG